LLFSAAGQELFKLTKLLKLMDRDWYIVCKRCNHAELLRYGYDVHGEASEKKKALAQAKNPCS